MKKIFLTVIVVLLAVTTVSAQYKGDWGVGPKIGVYTNAGADGAIFGIGAAGQYSITDNWRVAPSILALCKTGCSVDISADVQYLFNIAPDWHIYPLAGISANDIGDWSCGINLGGGADFSITRNWDVSAGFKWMIQTAKDYVPGFVKRRNPIHHIHIHLLFDFYTLSYLHCLRYLLLYYTFYLDIQFLLILLYHSNTLFHLLSDSLDFSTLLLLFDFHLDNIF